MDHTEQNIIGFLVIFCMFILSFLAYRFDLYINKFIKEPRDVKKQQVFMFFYKAMPIISCIILFLIPNTIILIFQFIVMLSYTVQHILKMYPSIEKEIEEKFSNSNIYAAELVVEIEEAKEVIREKSNNLLAMLEHLPLGVYTIEKGFKIHQEYSKCLENIFSKRSLTGSNGITLLVEGSTLRDDQIKMMEDTISCCMNESEITFLANHHLLPKFIHKQTSLSEQILEITWTPIYDNNQFISKIMVIVKDISNFEELKKTSIQKDIRLQMVLDLIEVQQDKIERFFTSFQEMAKDIHSNLNSQPPKINNLLRLSHTIKGNSRSLGLHKIVSSTHKFEEYMNQSKNNVDKVNPHIVFELIQNIIHDVEQYQDIYKTKILKNDIKNQSSFKQIENLITNIDNHNLDNPTEISALLKKHLFPKKQILIKSMFSNSFIDLKDICKKLKKEVPLLLLKGDDFNVTPDEINLLVNIFNHIFSNAIDHGIEYPQQRLDQNKPSQGTISLSIEKKERSYTIEVQDDGKGLDLKKIKKVGINEGYLREDAPLDDIANSIFEQGITTASKISQISGLGLGLNAVKDIISTRGRIRVKLFDKIDKKSNYTPFSFEIELDNHDVV